MNDDDFSLCLPSMVSSYAIVLEYPNRVALFYQPGMDGTATNTVMLNLPCLGPVALDAVLFTSSAILFRLYMMIVGYRTRRRKAVDDDNDKGRRDYETNTDNNVMVVKARVVGGYKDPGLYQTMKECEDVKLNLRRVIDPDVARRRKQQQMKRSNAIINATANRTGIESKFGDSGYLGMSPGQLQTARKLLKQVDGGFRCVRHS
jgi:hypothetical protein